ncbi:hypothetical protein [Massilia sp.]|uniref:hypothetical protein n=1 Tax=Massilia sp. TaxID=1882437 RepID=UPI00352E9B94
MTPRLASGRIRTADQGVDDLNLVCCLNVVDRVARPVNLVDTSTSHMRPDGMHDLASPLTFDLRFTSDRVDWVDDLEALLRPARWRIIGREDVCMGFAVMNAKRSVA